MLFHEWSITAYEKCALYLVAFNQLLNTFIHKEYLEVTWKLHLNFLKIIFSDIVILTHIVDFKVQSFYPTIKLNFKK